MECLLRLAEVLALLDQQGTDIVDPFGSIIGVASFKVKSSAVSNDGEAHGVELLGDLVESHDCRRAPQSEVDNVLEQDGARLLSSLIGIYPQQLILFLGEVEFTLYGLDPMPAVLDEDVPLDELDS